MLLPITRPDNAFLRALRAAVAAHCPAALSALLAAHGERVFARALGDLSGRVIADALSMLAVPERAGVLCHLPRAARSRLLEAEGGAPGRFAMRGQVPLSPSLRQKPW